MMELSWVQWVIVIMTAFLVGFSKTGIGGVMMLAIPILAGVFGGKGSTGIMLPMLVAGDIIAVWYYRKSVNWNNVFKPLPWAFAGLALGVVIGNFISDRTFIIMMGVIILLCLFILIYTEVRGKDFTVPDAAWFYILVGVLSGFATMIGNAAGPIFTIYLLALGFNKNKFMGTNAWFFFLINLSKLPLQIFFWHNIGLKAFTLSVIMVPVIILGAVLGIAVIKRINEKFFRYLVMGMTAVAAVRLFWN